MLVVRIKKQLENFLLDVDFSLEYGVLGLLGASGCGKSMTLRCIAGVETPDEGYIALDDVVFYDSKKRINLSPQQRKTALLPQNYQLFPNLTIEQNIAAGIDTRVAPGERRAFVASYLEQFGLVGFEKRYPVTLSGGQQQRVALARMLAADPGVLMLDEPFSALDAHLKSKLEQELRQIFQEQKVPILYVSHDIDEAYRLTHEIAVMDAGSIVEKGASKDIVDNPTTYAGMKLSGCKNIVEAHATGKHHVEVPAWGMQLEVAKEVPTDVRFIGVRAFFIQDASGANVIKKNILHGTVVNVSETRFNALLEVKPQDALSDGEHIFWRISTLEQDGAQRIPQIGDAVTLYLDPKRIYIASS